MFLPYCASCFTRHDDQHLLCFPCRDELHDLELGSQDRILSCFKYRGVMRRLILRAKVQGDHRAVSLLTEIVVSHPLVETWISTCDVVMPSPSSLWGRARGRLDLAALLANAIARHYGRPVRAAPWELHWRLRKRALAPRAERKPMIAEEVVDQETDGPRIGLFDDVVTTGQTMAWTQAALPAGSSVRALTLASARETSTIISP